MCLPAAGQAEAPQLDYQVVAGPDVADDAPLVLAIHGLGDSARGFGRFAQSLELPVRFVVPNAPTARPGGGFSWYRVRSPQAAEDVAASTAKLAALIKQVRARWPKAPAPLVVGFSQGGVMGFSLAARHPDLVRGVVAIAGYLIPDDLPVVKASARPPLLIVHGRADQVVPFARGQAAAKHFEAAGYPVAWAEHAGAHTIGRDAAVRVRDWLRTKATPAAR